MLTLLREMSARTLIRAPLRSALVLLGIALGVAIFVASEATSASLLASFDELTKRVAGEADMMVVGDEAGIDGEWLARVAEVPGVAHAAAALEVTTLMPGDPAPLLVMGVDFLGDTHFLPFEPLEGQQDLVEDPLAFANDPTALLIPRTLARRKNLAVGDELTLVTSDGERAFSVAGVVDDRGPAASFGGQVVVMFLDAAQIAFSRGRLIDRIDVAVEQTADKHAVREAIAQRVNGVARVVDPDWRGQRLRTLTDPMRQTMRLFGYIALLVGMLLIYNAIGVSVAQRRREVGVLRALGVRRRGILLHFCLEALVVAIPGIALGLMLSQYLVTLGHGQTLEAIKQTWAAGAQAGAAVPTITPTLAAKGTVAGILMTLVAAYLPALRGARMDPVEALQSGAGAAPRVPALALFCSGVALMVLAWAMSASPIAVGTGVTTLLNMVGGAMTAPGIVLASRRALMGPVEAVFGISGRLGLDYAQRSLARSSVNVVALWLAVSMSVAVGGWLNSFETALRGWFDQITAAQLSVTAGSPVLNRRRVPLSAATLNKLEGLPGLQAMQPIRVTDQSLSSGGLSVVASDLRVYLREAQRHGVGWNIVEGPDRLSADALVESPRAVLSENAAVRLKLGVGDPLVLRTPTGTQHFEIAAVVVDYSSERGAAFIDRSHYVRLFRDEAIDAINLYLVDGADPVRVAQAARKRLGGGDSLFVIGTTELRKHFFKLLAQGFAYTRSLELIVLVIALLGVVGTLVSAVLDRMREIGMLRAIGTSRRQLTSAVVVEATFLGLCATLGGILSGAIQCQLFLATVTLQRLGWRIDFMFPWEATARMTALVLVAAAVAGLLPGHRAARLKIREAIGYE
ncbi:MAG: ABC transporter permease [Myxococcales bacterium]|nr:ABC transporter permease [Myxococcales bacterium]